VKLFINNLTNVDFSYLHPTRGLVGESWLAQLEVDGSLNEQGMICDFGIVKKLVRDWLDNNVDHMLVVPDHSEQVSSSVVQGQTEVSFDYVEGGQLVCTAPSQAIALVDVEAITPESLAFWCQEQLLKLFPSQVRGLQLRFHHEQIDGAFYHYSHGLQQHDGNCQRIAHGHRSRLEILLNGERNSDLEQQWAERWADIYLGTSEHRVMDAPEGVHHYQYEAPQGLFDLTLPAARCDDLTTETTVEQIARHLAERIKQVRPLDEVEVRAYEGIGKGAVAIG